MARHKYIHWSEAELLWCEGFSAEIKGKRQRRADVEQAYKDAFPDLPPRPYTSIMTMVYEMRRGAAHIYDVCPGCFKLMLAKMMETFRGDRWCPDCLNADDPKEVEANREMIMTTGYRGTNLGQAMGRARPKDYLKPGELNEAMFSKGVPLQHSVRQQMDAEFTAAKAHKEDGHPWPREGGR